jgi:hypothetical protein
MHARNGAPSPPTQFGEFGSRISGHALRLDYRRPMVKSRFGPGWSSLQRR